MHDEDHNGEPALEFQWTGCAALSTWAYKQIQVATNVNHASIRDHQMRKRSVKTSGIVFTNATIKNVFNN